MEIMIIAVIFLYILSSGGYFAYFFLQKEYLHKIAFYIFLSGFSVHFLTLFYQFDMTSCFPVRNLHQSLLLTGFAISFGFVIFQSKFNLKILGIYVSPLITVVTTAAFFIPNSFKSNIQLKNIYADIWLIIHVITSFLGTAFFALACGIGILYLFQEHAIKKTHSRFFLKRLPSLEMLDSSGYACIIAGFIMLSFGLITGFIYANFVWGKFWSWDTKEVWSGITWLLYAALMHERLAVGWRGHKSALLAIIGFILILFTFLGVNLIFNGHHKDFTRW